MFFLWPNMANPSRPNWLWWKPYGAILAKREGYGLQGNGGNGLLLHSALAVDPEQGQPLGLLWQKLWHRQYRAKPPADETPEQKKQRRAKARNDILNHGHC